MEKSWKPILRISWEKNPNLRVSAEPIISTLKGLYHWRRWTLPLGNDQLVRMVKIYKKTLRVCKFVQYFARYRNTLSCQNLKMVRIGILSLGTDNNKETHSFL